MADVDARDGPAVERVTENAELVAALGLGAWEEQKQQRRQSHFVTSTQVIHSLGLSEAGVLLEEPAVLEKLEMFMSERGHDACEKVDIFFQVYTTYILIAIIRLRDNG